MILPSITCVNAACDVKTNWFMVRNPIPEPFYPHQLIENSTLSQWLRFVWENAKNAFPSFVKRMFGEKMSPKAKR